MKFDREMLLILASLALRSAEPKSVNRIANGNLAAPGEFPYMVSLQQLGEAQSKPTRGHFCAGALISYRHVVTTAVCVHKYTAGFPELIDKNKYRVFAGSNLLNDDSSGDYVRPILSSTVHPNFSGFPALVNNIAVITLEIAFKRLVVTPLSLPDTNVNPAEFDLCTVAGWGSLDRSDDRSVELRYSIHYIYNQDSCTSIYNTAPDTKIILPSMVCAVPYDLKSSNCYGDVGNPLVCGKSFTGILSSSDNCTHSIFPEVYTRISSYTSWIKNVSGASHLINPGILVLFLLSFITSLF